MPPAALFFLLLLLAAARAAPVRRSSDGSLSGVMQKWREYQRQCLKYLYEAPPIAAEGKFCNRTFDNYACWPDGLPGTYVNVSCPSYLPWANTGGGVRKQLDVCLTASQGQLNHIHCGGSTGSRGISAPVPGTPLPPPSPQTLMSTGLVLSLFPSVYVASAVFCPFLDMCSQRCHQLGGLAELLETAVSSTGWPWPLLTETSAVSSLLTLAMDALYAR